MKASLICFAGDTHCGSFTGLWPLEDLPQSKTKYVGIRYLMECWEYFIKNTPQIDVLAILGDVIDGKQPKSNYTGIFTTDMGEQAETAVRVWQPLVNKAKKVIRVHGTPYHETHDTAPLDLFDKSLGITLSQQVINLDLDGQILNIAHHPVGGMTLYSGTATDREGLWSILAAYEGSAPDARWIVRGHKHHYLLQESRTRTVCLAPCWQLQTPHAVKQNYWKWQPVIGSVTMHQDKTHHGGWRFTPMLFDPPEPSVVKSL